VNTVAIVLSSVGGLLELGGLALVVLDIVADREQARTLFAPRDALERRERSYPAPVHAPSWVPPSQASVMLTPAQHRDAAAKESHRTGAAVANALVRLKKATDAELDREIERVERMTHEREEVLRRGLVHVLAGSIKQRTFGAVLLGLGIGFATAGSVVSSLG